MKKEKAIDLLRHCEAEDHCSHYRVMHECSGCNKRVALDMDIEALKTDTQEPGPAFDFNDEDDSTEMFANISEDDFAELLARVSFSYEIKKDEKGRDYISLTDLQGAPMGDVESTEFHSPEEVVDRMAMYWEHEFLIERDDGISLPNYHAAMKDALRDGEPDLAKLIAIVSGESIADVAEELAVKKVSISYLDAVDHLRKMYEYGMIPKNANGEYCSFTSDEDGPGWVCVPEELAAKNLMDDLDQVDDIQRCFLEKGFSPPGITNILIHREDGSIDAADITETALGEPQWWIYLPDKTSIEIVHEQHGISENNHFYSCRLHCSEEDFEADKYHMTMGVITQSSSKNLTYVAMIIQNWINESIEKCGKEVNNGKEE